VCADVTPLRLLPFLQQEKLYLKVISEHETLNTEHVHIAVRHCANDPKSVRLSPRARVSAPMRPVASGEWYQELLPNLSSANHHM
jgi:hypothetical protein